MEVHGLAEMWEKKKRVSVRKGGGEDDEGDLRGTMRKIT